MSEELKLIAKRLTAVFATNPGPTRQALAEALPLAVKELAAIATGKDTARARMKAINELLALQRRIVAEDLRRATVQLKRREVEVKIIEGRVAEIRAKTEQDFEARQKRKALAKAGRILAAAKRVPDAT
jgi:hypothetical protein